MAVLKRRHSFPSDIVFTMKLLGGNLSRRKKAATAANEGAAAEAFAAEWLTAKGLKILSRNYRTKAGEIDLIATESNTLVFVEVRFRKRLNFGLPAETIDRNKQQRLIRAALQYLQQHAVEQPCRFDSLCLTQGSGDTPFRVEWLRDAFQVEEH